jgi:hypothetical protein
MFYDSEREMVAGVTRDGSVSILTNAVFVWCARHEGGKQEGPTVRKMQPRRGKSEFTSVLLICRIR